MKLVTFSLISLLAVSAIAADHAGLDSTFKCVPKGDKYNLVKELNAVSIYRINNVHNQYTKTNVSETIIAEEIDMDTCINAVAKLEAAKIIKQ